MGEWQLSKLLKQESRVVRLDDKQSYKLLGVKWYGQGMFLREEKKGSEIKAEKLYQVKAGDFVYNRLFAWKSSFAIVPEEFDGCLVSNEFPTFTAVDGQVDLEFILRYILLPQNIDQVNRVSGGMSSVSRKRFKEADFLDFTIPKLSLKQQQTICKTITRREAFLAELEAGKSEQLSLLKQLRQAVLQGAVEGKLTAEWRRQHPVVKGDLQHDATALQAQIKAEKERLVKEGEIRKGKPLPPIAESEKPFNLPIEWLWTRLGEVAQSISTGPFGSMLHKSDYVKNGIPLVNPMNMVANRIVPSNKMMVSQETCKRLERYMLNTGNIVVARRGDLSKCAIVDAENDGWLCGTGSFFLKLCQIDKAFFIKYFVSSYAQSYLLRDSIGQTMDNLNQGLLSKLPFPLPPLAEQQAIVASVDSLMATIDELEKQVSERKEQAQLLMQTVLREAFTGSAEDGN